MIGVLGAGTMGAGIAQLACLSGAETLLHDPVPAALEGLKLLPERVARDLLCSGIAGGARSGWYAVGFHVLPPFPEARLVELTRSPDSAEDIAS